MKKKNGFTLIELLAVILILGVIALIAIPTVNKILDEAKKGAFESTLNNIEKKIGETCSMQLLRRKPITNTYTISGGSISPIIDLKGKLPDGEITVDNQCNVTYQLSDKIYLASKDTINGKPEITKCNGNCRFKYAEDALNGATPKLDDSMIPVVISNDGTVKKADLYSQWYKYDDNDIYNDNSKWANAVITTSSSREEYKNANVNSFINPSDILAYLVWIPRFSYKIPAVSDKNNPPLITIEFENKDISKKNGDAISTVYTHPAFTFDGKELDGIWVGKFETTGTDDAPTVLPNTNSLRNQNVSDQFATALNFKNYNVLGDTHMMKNSEWGAVAYLSHSKYGSNEQIRINNYYNNNKTLTGCGASVNDASESNICAIQYGKASNYPQSTTNNISGIFDMSGGVYEIVMGNYNNIGASGGFKQEINPKYYDLFNGDTYETACNSGPCKGHANYETNEWYSDIYYVTNSTYPWIARSGAYNCTSTAGVFSTHIYYGGGAGEASFRLTIVN